MVFTIFICVGLGSHLWLYMCAMIYFVCTYIQTLFSQEFKDRWNGDKHAAMREREIHQTMNTFIPTLKSPSKFVFFENTYDKFIHGKRTSFVTKLWTKAHWSWCGTNQSYDSTCKGLNLPCYDNRDIRWEGTTYVSSVIW